VEYSDPDGDRAKAVEHLTDALRVRRAAGDRRGVAAALNNLGNLAFAREDWNGAERAFAETLEHERALGHPFGIARALNNLGEVAEERGEYAKAARLYVAAEHLFREVRHNYADYSAERLAALRSTPPSTEAQIADLSARSPQAHAARGGGRMRSAAAEETPSELPPGGGTAQRRATDLSGVSGRTVDAAARRAAALTAATSPAFPRSGR
jgi:tetratricopeptide (TPR) repeat protein